MLTDADRARLIMTVLDRDEIGEDEVLGDAMMPLKGMRVTHEPVNHSLKLINPATGNPTGGYIEVNHISFSLVG